MSTIRTARRPIAAALRSARSRALGIRNRHPNPYATHIPVLLAVSQITQPKAVLELGSGPFSTSLFLNREAFPHLQTLVSYEDDPQWAKTVSTRFVDDARLDYRLVERVPSAVPDDISAFDIVFIDDSVMESDRARTIRSVLSAKPRGLVVIHDFENRYYRAAVRGSMKRFVMGTFNPQVGILASSNEYKDHFRHVSSVLEIGAVRNIDLEDVDAWLSLLRRHVP